MRRGIRGCAALATALSVTPPRPRCGPADKVTGEVIDMSCCTSSPGDQHRTTATASAPRRCARRLPMGLLTSDKQVFLLLEITTTRRPTPPPWRRPRSKQRSKATRYQRRRRPGASSSKPPNPAHGPAQQKRAKLPAPHPLAARAAAGLRTPRAPGEWGRRGRPSAGAGPAPRFGANRLEEKRSSKISSSWLSTSIVRVLAGLRQAVVDPVLDPAAG